MVDTADRVLSNLRDLPHGVDNIDAAIVHMLAERFGRTYRGDVW
jgi:chorismate mutase